MRHRHLPVLLACFLAWILPANAGASVYRWGLGMYTPTLVPNLPSPTLIDAGNADGYAIESGVVKAWGSGQDGALGDGTTLASEAAVTVNLPAGVTTVSLGEAERSGFAVTTAGTVYDWGDNKNGDLCQGPKEVNVKTPELIPGLSGVVAAQGAKHSVIFLLANGTIEACGWNEAGQLGLGPKLVEATSPTPVPGVSNIVELSVGPKVSTLRTAGGEVLVAGTNLNGQIGLGEGLKRVSTFTRVPLPGRASSISVGGGSPVSHTLVLVEGVPYGWGRDEGGEIGDGSSASKYTPVVASELATYGFTSLKAAGHSSIGLVEGNVYSWGANQSGELGIGEEGEGEGEEGEALEQSFSPQFVDSGVAEISATARNVIDRH
jgi:alpha-tubulin suppressor-like RCC1 family protein